MKIGLLQFLKKFFKKPTQLKKTNFKCHDYDLDFKKQKQEWSDMQLERQARQTALDMYDQYIKGNCIIIKKPIASFITCHYPFESKYTSESYDQLVNLEYKKIIEQYGIIRNGNFFDNRK